MADPTTEAGRTLLDAVRAAALPPGQARLIGPDGKQQLVSLVSVELLERDILAIEREAVAAFVWERLEATPGFNEEMAEALADVKAGRVTSWAEVKARLDAEGAPDAPEPADLGVAIRALEQTYHLPDDGIVDWSVTLWHDPSGWHVTVWRSDTTEDRADGASALEAIRALADPRRLRGDVAPSNLGGTDG